MKASIAFGLHLNLVDVGKFILVGTGLIGGKLGMGIGWHSSPPLLKQF